MTEQFDIIIAGAGMVGVSTALWAQKSGYSVAICDANSPGSGCSYGPACVIADYACLPVNNPNILKNIPYLLFSKDSPLSMNFGYALRNPKWLMQFLSNCRTPKVNEITRDLAGLLARANEGLDPLIALTDAHDLIVQNGVYYLWSTPKGYQTDQAGLAMRAQYGVVFDEMDGQELARREPHLAQKFHRAVFFKHARHILDTEELITRMSAIFLKSGGTIIKQNIQAIGAEDRLNIVTLSDKTELKGQNVIICAGACSKSVQGAGLKRLPLGTERGYHVTYHDEADKLSCPIGWAEAGFYATPTKRGLRLAGTVEIAALDAPMNTKRIAYIRKKGEALFGELTGESETWLGCRPTLPDARPVLGQAPFAPNIWCNFGHQHLGITLGGATGKAVIDALQSNETSALNAFSPNRYS